MKARIEIKDLEQSSTSNTELQDLSLKDMSNVKGGVLLDCVMMMMDMTMMA
ncbi:MAG: hypothetical protein F6K56_45400 [Moorea sp. SIO3G5]|nr:hypothetical protein [Moorena sp. SIO3G5]